MQQLHFSYYCHGFMSATENIKWFYGRQHPQPTLDMAKRVLFQYQLMFQGQVL